MTKWDWTRVTKANPCPVCGKDSWCTVSSAGVTCCMRVESSRPCRNAMGGWLHGIGEKHAPYTPPPRKFEPPRIDAAGIMRDWKLKTKPEWIAELAMRLGVGADSLDSIGTVWAARYRAFAFPMHDGWGGIVGIRLRDMGGKKWSVTGSRSGVFISRWSAQQRMYITEGPTDLASALTLGLFAIGRPSCMGSEDQINQTIQRLDVREVVIIADNDDKQRPDGAHYNPGVSGAARLQGALRVQSCILTLPSKDCRQFVKDGGTREIIAYLVSQQVWMNP